MVHVEAADAGRAVAAASLDVEEGAVGAGTGMVCFGWKGGIGTLEPADRTTAHGRRARPRELRLGGAAARRRPAGRAAARGAGAGRGRPAGSCIAVVATDAPLAPAQLERLARRAGLGLARTGSVAHHGSGEIFVAFATARRRAVDPDDRLDPLFQATVEATEEAVLNALWAAMDTTGREGRVVRALPRDDVVQLYRARPTRL